MNNELTKTDIEKMKAELDDRRLRLMPELLEEVKRTRAFGDLSENFEYKAAKQAQNKNRSRIRYLERMIASAQIIEDRSAADEVGLYDRVRVFLEPTGEEQTVQVVTTVRIDPLHGRVSKDSPLGRAILGRHVGDRVVVRVSDEVSYGAVIRGLEKGEDDGSAELLSY